MYNFTKREKRLKNNNRAIVGFIMSNLSLTGQHMLRTTLTVIEEKSVTWTNVACHVCNNDMALIALPFAVRGIYQDRSVLQLKNKPGATREGQ